VHIRLTQDGEYEVADLVHGDTVTDVLEYVQFDSEVLIANFRRKVARATSLSRSESNAFIADYIAGLAGYTYLEGDVR
jgi:arginine decarboxylase